MTMPSKKTILVITGFLGAITLMAILLFFLTAQIKAEGQKLNQTRQKLDSFLQNWKNLEKAKEESSAVESKLNQTSIFLKPGSAIKFIQSVESFAQATQNRESISVLNNLIPKNQEEKSNENNTLSFQISLWGDYPNLIKFLIYLENAPNLNTVDSLQISRLDEKDISQEKETIGSQAGDIKSIVNLSVYQQ